MERTVLGIDIGTTSVKAVLVSRTGRIVDEVSAPHDLISLKAGWAEQHRKGPESSERTEQQPV